MTKIKPVDPNTANPKTKEAFEQLQKKMGRIPNIFLSMGNSAATLNGYLAFSGALAQGVLDPKLKEKIAIVVAETNQCQYCLSAHVTIAKGIGVSDAEINSARDTQSTDPKTDAAMTFTRNLILKRQDLPDNDFEVLKSAGFTDEEITELIAVVCLNIFTNYFNLINKTEVDFPKVELAFAD